ncbi:MAG: hypothetical protein K0Q66_1590, partial [Chitinophagaceae bacterium]|nr:hypothetical protein [Chitinophagaceae bacterium]
MTFTARTVFLILLFLSSRSFAQTPFYKTYTLPGGAVAPTINCLYQESRGYILVGATTGLYRFDGVSFQKVQAEKNVPTDVTSICETKDGKTWIGFGDGKLGWLQQHQLVLQNPEEGHPTKAIKKIIQDSAGVVWIATAGEGLYYYKDKQFYNINTDDGLSDDYVYDVMADNTGVVAATDRGINLCSVKDKKHIKQYTTTDGLQDNIVRCLASRNKDIYYGTDDGGIGIVYRQNSTTPGFAYNRNWPRGKVNAILISGQHLWIGYNDGVYKAGLSTDPGAHEDIPERLVKHLDLVITHFLQDAEGNTWAASNDQLIRTNGSKLQSLISLPAAEAANTHTLLIDRDDHLWMNVREGLRHLEKDPSGQWKERIYRLPVTINSQITALYEDKFENIWIGTMGNGAFILDPANGKFRKITENKVLQSASVLSITGKNDHVWLASLEGATLARLTEANNDINHPLSIESITTIGGIGTNYIYNIFVDSKDRTWFATDGKGIAMLDKGQITNYGQAQGLKSEVAYRVAEDPQGTIWFTTFNGGLVKFDGNQFRHYGLAEGLSDLNITSLVPDGNGNLYVVHKSGIDIIDTKTGAISYLDAEQGLRDINTDLNAVAAGSNGDIYFIANDAVYRYTSSLAKAQPRITIDRIQLFLNDADVRDGHVFSASEDNISFYYTGLFYSQPGKIQYQYKLEGYGEDWITTNDRRKDFPKLPPGNYT